MGVFDVIEFRKVVQKTPATGGNCVYKKSPGCPGLLKI
jgi:hypothetical protein